MIDRRVFLREHFLRDCIAYRMDQLEQERREEAERDQLRALARDLLQRGESRRAVERIVQQLLVTDVMMPVTIAVEAEAQVYVDFALAMIAHPARFGYEEDIS